MFGIFSDDFASSFVIALLIVCLTASVMGAIWRHNVRSIMLSAGALFLTAHVSIGYLAAQDLVNLSNTDNVDTYYTSWAGLPQWCYNGTAIIGIALLCVAGVMMFRDRMLVARKPSDASSITGDARASAVDTRN